MSSPVSTEMGDRMTLYAIWNWVFIDHAGQLSLAIPPWMGVMSTGRGHANFYGRLSGSWV